MILTDKKGLIISWTDKSGLIVGSGKITRRILQKHMKRLEYLLREARRLEEKKKPLPRIHVSKDQRVVLNHWNSKGKPFTMHRINKDNPTSTLRRVLNSTARWLKKSKIDTIVICDAIDNVYDLFTSEEFKYKNWRGLTPLQLDAFYCYDTRHINPLLKKSPKLAEELVVDYSKRRFLSWFKEGRKGSDYLAEKYSRLIKDPDSNISKMIEDVWTTYRGDGFTLRPRDTNTIRRVTKRVMEFGNANPETCPPAEVVNRIQYMFDTMNYKPKYLSYLANNIFWHEQFPEELIRWGGHSRRDVVIP